MNQIEHALINDCAKKCAKDIQKTAELFKTTKYAEQVLIVTSILEAIKTQLKDSGHAH